MRLLIFTFPIWCLPCLLVGAEKSVSYNDQVRPILSEKCFACHGFDAKKRKAELRLDTFEGATDTKRDKPAIIPGNAAASEAIVRILSDDPEEVMPPPESVHSVTDAELAILKTWINEGAVYEKHWAFLAPIRPTVPQVADTWSKNPIDAFVAQQWQDKKFTASPEADRATLMRRLHFDLIGLPPTLEELRQFQADTAPDAYEKVVDRLLASPHYGERMALPWLDAARYADSNGFQQDGDTHQYVWRDWLIKALNDNMRFDQFTIEQMAGDLLPQSTVSQKVATGFHRCHLLNGEGGAIAEEQRNVILFDRVDVTATNWLGLTLACSQCHDHKYDPLTQKDYYAMMAFFNQVPETGVPPGGAQYRIAEPTVIAGGEAEMQQLAQLEQKLAETEQEIQTIIKGPEFADSLIKAEQQLRDSAEISWTAVTPTAFQATDGVILSLENDQSLISSGSAAPQADYHIEIPVPESGITALRFDLIPDARFPAGGSGRAESGNAVLSKLVMRQGEQNLKSSRNIADYTQGGFSPDAIFDEDPQSGWAFVPDVKTPHFLAIQLQQPIAASGGVLSLGLSFRSRHIAHMFGRFRISVTDRPMPLEKQALKPELAALLKKERATLTAAEIAALQTHLRELDVFSVLAEPRKRKAEWTAKRDQLRNSLPKVMVMSDAKPRKTFIYDRGSYEMPTTEVHSDTPAVLPPMAADLPKNRLGLAKWIMSAENPLTARVQVNRIWQHYFGHGIVKTSENFGLLGDLPTHPQLLDWLAVEFRESGWNLKHIHRLIVTSATYRQSSRVTADLLSRDPENKWYARASRFRLSSMVLRDLALQTSGLLDSRLFGKPVYPYQPPAIWDSLGITKERDFTYPQSQGADLYRRSIYTFWRRTVAPGNMFDMSARRTCVVKNSITSTPLHALTMLNDVTWVEASRALAQQLMQASPDVAAWPQQAFEKILQRPADAHELEILKRAWNNSLTEYQKNPQAARDLLALGSSTRNNALDPVSHAALTHVCLSLYNLDEALTRQ